MNSKITLNKGAFAKTTGFRAVAIKSGYHTIARMVVNVNTGEVSFEDIQGDISVTEHSIEFKKLTSNTFKIMF
jgi:hypothetical protein